MAKPAQKPKRSAPSKTTPEETFELFGDGAPVHSPVQTAPGAVPLSEDDTGHRFLLYATDEGVSVDLRFDGGTFWASQGQMAEMFGVNVPTISRHLKNVFDDGELEPGSTVSKIERVAAEGTRQVTRQIDIYNLNAIISVGYRVGSKQGTLFRIWASEKLFAILTKGFYVDKDRLKNRGEPDVLDEFREIAREIRTSIRNSYREVLRLCTLCADYDGSSEVAREFFSWAWKEKGKRQQAAGSRQQPIGSSSGVLVARFGGVRIPNP